MMFVQWRNHLTTHFSEWIPVIKWHVTLFAYWTLYAKCWGRMEIQRLMRSCAFWETNLWALVTTALPVKLVLDVLEAPGDLCIHHCLSSAPVHLSQEGVGENFLGAAVLEEVESAGVRPVGQAEYSRKRKLFEHWCWDYTWTFFVGSD